MRNDPREGTPLSQAELHALLRLLVLGAKNIKHSGAPDNVKCQLYERQYGVAEMVNRAPDLVRLEIRKAAEAENQQG